MANAMAFQQDTPPGPSAAADSAAGPLGSTTPYGATPYDPDTRLTAESWLAASVQCQLLRDHVKMHVLRPGAYGSTDSGEDADGMLGGFLMGVAGRHAKFMGGRLREWAAAQAGAGGPAGGALRELGVAVDRAASGGDKFRAYCQLLVGVIKQQVGAQRGTACTVCSVVHSGAGARVLPVLPAAGGSHQAGGGGGRG